jgi:hypothetical protein
MLAMAKQNMRATWWGPVWQIVFEDPDTPTANQINAVKAWFSAFHQARAEALICCRTTVRRAA